MRQPNASLFRTSLNGRLKEWAISSKFESFFQSLLLMQLELTKLWSKSLGKLRNIFGILQEHIDAFAECSYQLSFLKLTHQSSGDGLQDIWRQIIETSTDGCL